MMTSSLRSIKLRSLAEEQELHHHMRVLARDHAALAKGQEQQDQDSQIDFFLMRTKRNKFPLLLNMAYQHVTNQNIPIIQVCTVAHHPLPTAIMPKLLQMIIIEQFHLESYKRCLILPTKQLINALMRNSQSSLLMKSQIIPCNWHVPSSAIFLIPFLPETATTRSKVMIEDSSLPPKRSF